MKLTIIAEDKAVYKNRIAYIGIDLSEIPVNIHALQFDDSSNTGHIEFTDKSNENITSIPNWAEIAFNKYDDAVAALLEKKQDTP